MYENSWRIKKIDVKGLLGRHNLDWNLHKKVNILGGRNGSGKSTLLRAIAILLKSSLNFEGDRKRVNFHCEALYDSLSAELYSGACLRLERAPSITNNENEEKLTDSFKKFDRVTETITKGRAAIAGLPDIDMFAKNVIYINSADQAISSISGLIEKFGKINRPGVTTLDLLLKNALDKRNQLYTQRMLSITTLPGMEERIFKLNDLFQRFENAVKAFMPQYIISDSSTLTFAPRKNEKQKIKYFQLSTGEKQLLYILLTVANTLGESTILLLDEADMGMHIDWKKILLRRLLDINPNMQILAATHSPSLIEGWYENVKEISQLYSAR